MGYGGHNNNGYRDRGSAWEGEEVILEAGIEETVL
jgi:hypothetical protein